MKTCRHCEETNKRSEKFCANCGRPIHEEPKEEKYKLHLCGTTQLDPIGKI